VSPRYELEKFLLLKKKKKRKRHRKVKPSGKGVESKRNGQQNKVRDAKRALQANHWKETKKKKKKKKN
jgi:hypothetical protein